MLDIFVFRKISEKWVPKHLMEKYKCNRQDICCSLLRYNRKGDNFLNDIITGVETRIHHLKQKPNGRAWNGSTRHLLLPKYSSRCCLLEGSYWQCSGTPKGLFSNIIWTGNMAISVNYCDMLRSELRPATRTNWRERLSQGVVLLHEMDVLIRHTSLSPA